MKLNPAPIEFWTKQRIRVIVIIVLTFGGACFLPYKLRQSSTPKLDARPQHILSLYAEGDTLTFDITRWDSLRIDSLLRSFAPPDTTYDDSFDSLYDLSVLDSATVTDTALVNEFLRQANEAQ